MEKDTIQAVLERLIEGQANDQDFAKLRNAFKNGNLTLASQGGICVGGNVERSFVLTGENINITLPESTAEKLLLRAIQSPQMAPPSPSHIIGREYEIQNLVEKFLTQKEGRKILALRGMGGIGKTTLATALAHQPNVIATFPDGILWASLGPDPDIMTWLAVWGRQLGKDFSDYPLLNARSSALASALHNLRILLVVDDVWEIEDARPLLVGDINSGAIITTREWQVAQSLAGEANQNVDYLDEVASLQLLSDLAPEAIRVDLAGAKELAKALGGLPLALTLAGSLLAEEWQIGLGATNALDDLKNREDRLALEGAESRQGLPPGKISLRTVLAMSYDHLEEDSWRKAFRQLGAIGGAPNTFSLAAATAVWELDFRSSQKIMVKLVNHALVETMGNGRFALHQTLHDYASSLLNKVEEYDAHLHHATYTLSLASQYTQENITQWGEFDEDWENIRQVMNWLSAQSAIQSADILELGLCADMANALDYAIRARYPTEGLVWLKAGQIACHKLDRTIEEAWLSMTYGEISINLGNLDQALTYFQYSLKLFKDAGEKSGIRYAQGNLGILHHLRGENDLAVAAFLPVTQTLMAKGDKKGAAIGYFNLGNAYIKLGQYQNALVNLQESIRIFEEVGTMQDYLALATCNLAQVYLILENTSEAEPIVQRALSLANLIALRNVQGLAWQVMGELLANQGKFDDAVTFFEQSLDYFEEAGLHDELAEAHEAYGRILQRNQRQNQAAEHYAEAIQILNDMGATLRAENVSQRLSQITT